MDSRQMLGWGIAPTFASNRECAYCGAKNVPLEIEHIQGGSDRVSNLTLACTERNQKKGNKDIKEFLKRKLERFKTIAQLPSMPPVMQ